MTSTTDTADAAAIRRTRWLLFAVALLVRVLFLVFSDNADGDAYARLIWARRLVDEGRAVPTPVWLPAHFWILALPYAVGLQHQLWSRLLTALAGAATIPATHGLCSRWLSNRTATVLALLLAFNPLHVRLSIVTVSEPFFLLFVVLGLWQFFGYLTTGTWTALAVGAVAMNLACGHRMEGWLLLPCLPLLALVVPFVRTATSPMDRLRRAVVFTALSAPFTLGWLAFNYARYGDPLYNMHLTLAKNLTFAPYQTASPWYVAAFWPVVIALTLGPLAVALGVAGFVENVRRHAGRWVAGLLLGFLAVYYVQCARSGMNTDARYALLLVWLAIINAGAVLAARERLGRWVVASAAAWLVVIWGAAAAPLGSVAWKLRSISPQPTFPPAVHAVDDWLRSHAQGHAIALGTDLGAYGPWLSQLDDWYPRDRVEVLATPEALRGYIESTPDGYVVLEERSSQADVVRTEAPALGASIVPVMQTESYAVYRWSRPLPTDGAIQARLPHEPL